MMLESLMPATLLQWKQRSHSRMGVATHFRWNPLFSIRLVLPASSQHCCSVDADVRYKRALIIHLEMEMNICPNFSIVFCLRSFVLKWLECFWDDAHTKFYFLLKWPLLSTSFSPFNVMCKQLYGIHCKRSEKRWLLKATVNRPLL